MNAVNTPQFKNALVSVADKTGLVEFLKPLADAGMRIISSGGTAKHLKENGMEVVAVHEQTGFPEVMDGRVKTLHPHIHMPLLARGHVQADLDLLEEKGILPIDLVIGNLYPFEDALAKDLSERDLAEFIDIGGPSLLRAAAKNFERITTICNPSDYSWIAEKSELTLDDRKKLASKIFAHTSSYDAMIANQLGQMSMDTFSLGGEKVLDLRYGENPQQSAAWFRTRGERTGLHQSEIIQGKALSYNNLLDLEAACAALADFELPCAVSVKHTNPCGIGVGSDVLGAVEKSLSADPISVFGGIVAINRKVTEEVAERLTKLFLECVIAPEFDASALTVFAKKKNLRILAWSDLAQLQSFPKVRSIAGGFLVQNQDKVETWNSDWKVLREKPDDTLMDAIDFSWRACAHLKSNAIAITSADQTLGMGMGQVNRVDAVEQAIQRMNQHHPESEIKVLSSDAFFPFPDSIEKIAAAGIHWVVQPGGSIKDEDVIKRADELGVNLVLTGTRHFRH